ncbi:MAG: hypothetical protein AAFR20_01060 [Pseudomonadota bacterium]
MGEARDILLSGRAIVATTRERRVADFSGGDADARQGGRAEGFSQSLFDQQFRGGSGNTRLSRLLPEHGLRSLKEQRDKQYRLLLELRRNPRKTIVTIEDLPSAPQE